MNILYRVDDNDVVIIIPEGKTMLSESGEIPAANWTCSIPKSDTTSLNQYLTVDQIAEIQAS